MKLTRKDLKTPLVDAESVAVLFSQGEETQEGRLGVPVEIAKSCFLVLFDARELQEICQGAGFQPAGFRLNKIKPTELFVQFVRYVQKSGLGVGPLIKMMDEAASDVVDLDPHSLKLNLLEPPPAMDDLLAECWAAATWLKARSGKLDRSDISEISRVCGSWLEEWLRVSDPSLFPVKARTDESVVKLRDKLADWRERALEAEKQLESLRSARNAFEKELRDSKAEVRNLRDEVGKLNEQLASRAASLQSAEDKQTSLQSSLKDARARIARLEEELAAERAKHPAGDGTPRHPPERYDQKDEILSLHPKLERLQKTVDLLSNRMNEALLGPGRRAASPRGPERVVAFIDVANLDWAAGGYYGKRVDYEMLSRFLSSRTPTGHSRQCENIAFLSTDQRAGTDGFVQYLRSLGYRTVTRPIKVFPDGTTKGNVDVLLAVHAMRRVDDLDTAVIVSGDGDFCVLAEFFKSRGKRVEVLSFQNLGFEMRAVADEIVELGSRVLLSGGQKEIVWMQQK